MSAEKENEMCSEDFAHNGPVRSFPASLERKLVDAVRWYRERADLERNIAATAGRLNSSAERNQRDRDESDREGGTLLLELVEEMTDAWGIGKDV